MSNAWPVIVIMSLVVVASLWFFTVVLPKGEKERRHEVCKVYADTITTPGDDYRKNYNDCQLDELL